MMAPADKIRSHCQPAEQHKHGEENGNDAKKMKMFACLLNKTNRTKCSFTPVISLHFQNGAGKPRQSGPKGHDSQAAAAIPRPKLVVIPTQNEAPI
jgi:hypothetical protein